MITQSEILHTGMDLFSVQRTAGPISWAFIGIVVPFTCLCSSEKKAIEPEL